MSNSKKVRDQVRKDAGWVWVRVDKWCHPDNLDYEVVNDAEVLCKSMKQQVIDTLMALRELERMPPKPKLSKVGGGK